MIAIADTQAGHFYYAGLLLVIPYTYTFVQLRFAEATRAVVLIIASYEIVAIWVKATPVEILVNNNFFFLSSVIIGMAAGYSIERAVRSGFLQRRVIESQRRELAEHNEQLDSELQASLIEVRGQADELRASRARVVTAADEARRRIERDLHDGAQQRLVAIAVQLRLAAASVSSEDVRMRSVLQDIIEELGQATDELRALAHGIYPPLLSDGGLASALRVVAKRVPLPVTLEQISTARYDRDVETTVYFCVLEAMQNASKYAGPRATVAISIIDNGSSVRFEIADDGVGFDVNRSGVGAGFLNMSDRIGTHGGSLRVDSEPGRGITVIGEIPLPERAERPVELSDAAPQLG